MASPYFLSENYRYFSLKNTQGCHGNGDSGVHYLTADNKTDNSCEVYASKSLLWPIDYHMEDPVSFIIMTQNKHVLFQLFIFAHTL